MVEMGTGQQSVCDVKQVAVGDKPAAWIFAEFQSTRTVDQLADWLDPANWHKWGPDLFESVTALGERQTVKDPDGRRWHGKYLEIVSLGGKRLHTVLQCDGKTTSKWAAMTYDLDHSVGDVLKVDRGFLAAVDLGNNKRLVKALKIVGFTNTVDNAVATDVCPVWTEWMQKATTTAGAKADGSPVGETHGALGDTGGDDTAAADAAAGFTRGYGREWADYVSDMAQFYGEYATDVGNRLWSGDYGRKDATEDSGRLFLRLARDWSRVWRAGTLMADGLAGSVVPPTGGVPGGGAWKRSVEYSTVLIRQPHEAVTVAVSDLTSIGSKKATIRSRAITVDPTEIEGRTGKGGQGGPIAVRLQADTTAVHPGLYEGSLSLRPKEGAETTAPALFYASGARPLPGRATK
jgi:hypothetical protein